MTTTWFRQRLGAVVLAALTMTSLAVAVEAPSAEAATYSSTLWPGQTMRRGDVLRASNQRCFLTFQHDQNLVIYDRGTAIWNLRTYGSGADRVVMQGDGNLVMYRGHTPIWNTRTWGRHGARLAMQADCNLVVYIGSTPIWASNTVRSPLPTNPRIVLRQGAHRGGTSHEYDTTFSGFSAGAKVTATCRDSVDPGGFYSRTVTLSGSGSARVSRLCWSGDYGDHWVTVGRTTSNVVRWGSPPTPPPVPPTTSAPTTTVPTTTASTPLNPYELGSPWARGNYAFPINRGPCYTLGALQDHQTVRMRNVSSLPNVGITSDQKHLSCTWYGLTAGDGDALTLDGLPTQEVNLVPVADACRFITGESYTTVNGQVRCLWTKGYIPSLTAEGRYV